MNWMAHIFPGWPGRVAGACCALVLVCLAALTPAVGAQDDAPAAAAREGTREDEALSFDVKFYQVEGNSLFPRRRLRQVLQEFTGAKRTAADVEQARAALEKFFQDQGYPRLLVNIPQQEVAGGVVRLEVVETRIGRVRVTGNRYFTMDKIMGQLPSLQPGQALHVSSVEEEFAAVNRNPDLKVKINLVPTQEPGIDNLELQVEDALPLHGSLEVNNRSSHDTSALRLNASLRYDNLWQQKHSVGLQYQTAPLEPKEVQVVGGSYSLPAPWRQEHLIALYALWTDSDSAFGEGFQVVGNGTILGARYQVPLPALETLVHNLTFGVDYKDLGETTRFGEASEKTPISYLPLSLAWGGVVPGASGETRFKAGVNAAFRGLVGDQQEFADKRFKARGSYLTATLGAERLQKLPAGMELKIALDGQIASEPLVSSEQYAAGGMTSVRGYKESESLGDHALHGVLELSGPDLAAGRGWPAKGSSLRPLVFFEGAWLGVDEPLPGQEDDPSLLGAGAGFRGKFGASWSLEADWALAIKETDRTEGGDSRVHCFLKYQF